MSGSLPSLESLRDIAIAQKGISQDLNTAISRLEYVLNGVINGFQKSQKRWQLLIEQIEKKLPA